MYVHGKFKGCRSKNSQVMIVLSFVCFLHFWYWKNEISKNLFSKGYFKIVLCTFMTNFKIVGQRMTCVVYMLDLKIGKIAEEEQDQDKNYGPVGLTTGAADPISSPWIEI